ncbi:MAG: glycogen synthase GlgA [Proteobacteria bacterium]|nr:glycogen synthase GlgA [Pseudomonadota bacterium]
MKIVHIASEAVPFAKTGGLADVVGALPNALASLGDRVSVIMPFYGRRMELGGFGAEPPSRPDTIVDVKVGSMVMKARILRTRTPSGATFYFISEPFFFDREGLYGTPAGDYPDNAVRFIFFARAAVEAMIALKLSPDIVHAHDWQAALVPVYMRSIYAGERALKKAKSVLTIHNLGYQGIFPKSAMELTGLGWSLFTFDRLEFWDKVNFLKGGIAFADAITTVSERYAEEILTHEQGMGLETALAAKGKALTGILNGVDYSAWDPAVDGLIPANFSARSLRGKSECKEAMRLKLKLPMREGMPVVGMVGRLASQKGLDIFVDSLPALMRREVQFAILGTGEARFHDRLREAHAKYQDRLGLAIAFSEELAHLIEAGSDFFLMPSLYEPCGLNQMISLRYGTIPIVRATGGLADSVEEFDPKSRKGNGFKFTGYGPVALTRAVDRALALYKRPDLMKALIRNAMKCDFSWKRSAREYHALYKKLLKK